MAFRSELLQPCKRCKGTGTSNKEARDNDGNIVLAPIYDKREGDKPSYQNCPDCGGLGRSLQPAPDSILVEGEKVQLDAAAKRERFQDTLMA
jgi:DnaJ-class molecular chaperone